MTFLLLSSLILLTPVTGVVSGGRLTSFAMKSGLIPATQWMYVPGLPACSTGTFTDITFQGGCNKSFRVISSGETAGINPMIASRVTEDGYAAQMDVGDLSLYCVKNADTGSYALSYRNATIDIRGSSPDNLHPTGEYSDRYVLFAATENTSAVGVSFPFGEVLAIGPAFCKNRHGGGFWLLSKAGFGPLTVVSAPAIDEYSNYKRVYSVLEYSDAQLIYGWDGAEYFGKFSVQGECFNAEISIPVPGVLAGYRPSDNLFLLASYCEEGWFQGEIQGKCRGITAGVDLFRSPGNVYHFSFSVGIAIGNRGISEFPSFDSPWFSQMAVSPCQD